MFKINAKIKTLAKDFHISMTEKTLQVLAALKNSAPKDAKLHLDLMTKIIMNVNFKIINKKKLYLNLKIDGFIAVI